MWGDENLLHQIASFAGIPSNGWKTSLQILNALDRAPDVFEKQEVQLIGKRYVRMFRLIKL